MILACDIISLILFISSLFILLTMPSGFFLLDLVLRVWDVLLFEGNRVMLFRTALALIDLYGNISVSKH